VSHHVAVFCLLEATLRSTGGSSCHTQGEGVYTGGQDGGIRLRAGLLPPTSPSTPGTYTCILKRRNKISTSLQRTSSQIECLVVTICQATRDIQELSLPLNKSAVSDTSMRSCPSGRWKWGRESHFLRLLFTPLLLLPIGQSFTKSLLCAESWGCVGLRCRRSETGACSLEPYVSQLNTSTFELEGLPLFKLKKIALSS